MLFDRLRPTPATERLDANRSEKYREPQHPQPSPAIRRVAHPTILAANGGARRVSVLKQRPKRSRAGTRAYARASARSRSVRSLNSDPPKSRRHELSLKSELGAAAPYPIS